MAFQRTDPNREEFASRQGSRCTDSSMMDEILALLLQDHSNSSSSDEEQKESTEKCVASKDCGVAGQHCGSEKGESSGVEAHSPPFAAAPESGGPRHSISDISTMMVRQPLPVRMDFASVFRSQPPVAGPSGPSLPAASAPRASSEASIIELNDAEFENLKKRLRTQEASRRYRRRKKDTLRQQKLEIQELRSELARLHSIEADIEVMDQQSPTTVLRGFDAHAQELHERLDETRAVAEAELAVIRSIQDHLFG